MSVAVVGGGIAGLSAAYYLSRAGIPLTLIEKAPRLGGLVGTDVIEGCVLERGPDSFLAAKPWALDLIRELGMEGDVIGSNDARRITWVRRGGRLIRLPEGFLMVAPSRIGPMARSSLVGWRTKLRMGLEYFRRPPASPLPDRSVEAFVEDHYGREAVDYLAEPLLAGVYGGDPSRLSARGVLPRFVEMETRYGSLTRGALAEKPAAPAGGSLFQTLRGGLGTLVAKLEGAMGPRTRLLHAAVECVQPGGAGFRLRVGGDWIEADRVVLACPAHQATCLLGGDWPELSGLLRETPYSSCLTLSLGYRREDAAGLPAGFGFLVPKPERGRVLACTFTDAKFAHRAPQNISLLRCFLTGDIPAADDAAVVETARAELQDILGLNARPLFANLARWPLSMAQYTVGHDERMERVDALCARQPGLHLAGAAYRGVGIPDCIRGGKLAAERIILNPAG